MLPIKLLNIIIFFSCLYKNGPENIIFSNKKQDKSYTMTDLYLNHNIFFGHKHSYNYYDIDVNKILFLKNVILNTLLDVVM